MSSRESRRNPPAKSKQFSQVSLKASDGNSSEPDLFTKQKIGKQALPQVFDLQARICWCKVNFFIEESSRYIYWLKKI